MNPDIPVPQWGLSAKGIARHHTFNARDFIPSISAIYASSEQKAIDGACILAGKTGGAMTIIPELHENDRSATGFLPPDVFQLVADEFFARSCESVRGWERAVDAQMRIVNAVNQIITHDQSAGNIAIVAHGGVGALLLCHLMDIPISRALDQPGTGGGNYYIFDALSRTVKQGWQAIDHHAQQSV